MTVCLRYLLLACLIASGSISTGCVDAESVDGQSVRAQDKSSTKGLKKIVSLAPSLTEIIYELGAQESLVGVSNYCSQDGSLPKLGSLFQANFEAILQLRPDAVFLLGDHGGLAQKFSKLEIVTVAFKNDSIDEIVQKKKKIAGILEKPREARQLIHRIRGSVERAKKALFGKKVLVVVDTLIENGRIRSATLASSSSLFGNVITSLNGENPIVSKIRYPRVSAEALDGFEVDAILLVREDSSSDNGERLKHIWSKGRDAKVKILREKHFLSPGARLDKIVERMASIFTE